MGEGEKKRRGSFYDPAKHRAARISSVGRLACSDLQRGAIKSLRVEILRWGTVHSELRMDIILSLFNLCVNLYVTNKYRAKKVFHRLHDSPQGTEGNHAT